MAGQVVSTQHIVAIVNEGISCRVSPGEILARSGDTITYYNLTSGKVTVLFPDIDMFKEPAYSIDPGLQLNPLPIKTGIPTGTYPYTVYCDSIKEFAHASIPKIIIYDNQS